MFGQSLNRSAVYAQRALCTAVAEGDKNGRFRAAWRGVKQWVIANPGSAMTLGIGAGGFLLSVDKWVQDSQQKCLEQLYEPMHKTTMLNDIILRQNVEIEPRLDFYQANQEEKAKKLTAKLEDVRGKRMHMWTQQEKLKLIKGFGILNLLQELPPFSLVSSSKSMAELSLIQKEHYYKLFLTENLIQAKIDHNGKNYFAALERIFLIDMLLFDFSTLNIQGRDHPFLCFRLWQGLDESSAPSLQHIDSLRRSSPFLHDLQLSCNNQKATLLRTIAGMGVPLVSTDTAERTIVLESSMSPVFEPNAQVITGSDDLFSVEYEVKKQTITLTEQQALERALKIDKWTSGRILMAACDIYVEMANEKHPVLQHNFAFLLNRIAAYCESLELRIQQDKEPVDQLKEELQFLQARMFEVLCRLKNPMMQGIPRTQYPPDQYGVERVVPTDSAEANSKMLAAITQQALYHHRLAKSLVLSSNPSYVAILNGLGFGLTKYARSGASGIDDRDAALTEAQEWLEIALKPRSKEHDIIENYALLLLEQGKPKEALQAIAAISPEDRNQLDILYITAKAHCLQGEVKEARAMLNKYRAVLNICEAHPAWGGPQWRNRAHEVELTQDIERLAGSTPWWRKIMSGAQEHTTRTPTP